MDETVKKSDISDACARNAKKKKLNLFSRVFAVLLKPLLWIIYPVKIFFKDRFPENGGAVCVCNHYTPMDANAILTRLVRKNWHVMIKGEMFKNRIVGDFLLAIGGIPVHRGEGDIGAVKEVMSCLRRGEKVVIFPEGTRNKTNEVLLPLKSGVALIALKTSSLIVPLMYYRKIGFFRRNYLIVGNPFDLSEYVGRPSKQVESEINEKMRLAMIEAKNELTVIVEKYGASEKKYRKAMQESANEDNCCS